MKDPLLQFTAKSIYCPRADIHIDPWVPVSRAIITHAHSDHARPGSSHYLSHRESESLLRMRLGENISLQTMEYGETITINGVKISLHPAGHIIGSSQVRLEYDNEVWVASGDYKLEDDNFCTPFESVKCNVFITESTFGLPIYKWKTQNDIIKEIDEWVASNKTENKTSVLMGYSLGKMQRILKNISSKNEELFAHGAIYNINEVLRTKGYDLPELTLITKDTDRKSLRGKLVLAPPSADNSSWIKRFASASLGYCSGWMAVRGAKNRRAIDRGFVLSDHADWDGLNQAVKACGAEKVYVTHGFTNTYARWLNENNIPASEVSTMYGSAEEKEEHEFIDEQK